MKIAYILLAHQQPEQVMRLVERLDGEHAAFWIHYDKKAADADFERMQSALREKDNVQFMKRMRTHWGDFNLAWVPVLGMREILKSPGAFERVIYLTGQCYPIKRNAYILDRLAEEPDRSYMEFFPLPTSNWSQGGVDRYQNLHVMRNRRTVIKIKAKRKLPYNLQAFGGSAYWCLTREACEYVLTYIKKHTSLRFFFQFVKFPDELFFQTILMNSSLKNKIKNDSLWYIDWSRRPAPAILGKTDFEFLNNCSQLFARKFDIRVDGDILDLIDKKIINID